MAETYIKMKLDFTLELFLSEISLMDRFFSSFTVHYLFLSILPAAFCITIAIFCAAKKTRVVFDQNKQLTAQNKYEKETTH